MIAIQDGVNGAGSFYEGVCIIENLLEIRKVLIRKCKNVKNSKNVKSTHIFMLIFFECFGEEAALCTMVETLSHFG